MLEKLLDCARRWDWRSEGAPIDSFQEAYHRGARIGIFQDAGRTDWRGPSQELPTFLVPLPDAAQPSDVDFLVLISDRLWRGGERVPTLIWRPRTLTLGLSGPDTDELTELERAVRYYCEEHGWAFTSITALATTQDDPGLALFAEWADHLELPLLTYSSERLAILSPKPQLGREGFWQVEAAAMLAAGSKQLVASASLTGKWQMALARRQTG